MVALYGTAGVLYKGYIVKPITVIIPYRSTDADLLEGARKSVPMEIVERVVEVEDKDSKGAPWARNVGLAQSFTPWVFFLDADCRLLPGALELLLEQAGLDPGADFFYGKWMQDKAPCNAPPYWESVNPTMRFNEDLLRRENYISSMTLVRKGACPKWDETLGKFQDWDLWLRMTEQGKRGHGINQYIVRQVERKEGRGITDMTGSKEEYDNWKVHVWMKHEIPHVSLFTLTRDRNNYTERMLKSLKANAGYPYRHFYFDNGSANYEGNPLYTYFNAGGGVSNHNIGLKGGCRNAVGLIKMTNSPFNIIAKVDNDCEFTTPDSLKKLVWALVRRTFRHTNPDTGEQRPIAISPVVTGLNNPLLFKDTIIQDGYAYSAVDHIGGICCMATIEVWREFVKHDYPCNIARGQDLAFSNFLKESQGGMYYVNDVVVHHMDTTKGQETNNPAYFKRKHKEEQIPDGANGGAM